MALPHCDSHRRRRNEYFCTTKTMMPFRFGVASRRMFGAYHAAAASPASAVLICNPFGQEAIRAHRLVRVLAERVCRAGMDVRRYDAYGTGDAAGEDEDVDLVGGWGDVLTAHDELMKRSSARRIFAAQHKFAEAVCNWATGLQRV